MHHAPHMHTQTAAAAAEGDAQTRRMRCRKTLGAFTQRRSLSTNKASAHQDTTLLLAVNTTRTSAHPHPTDAKATTHRYANPLSDHFGTPRAPRHVYLLSPTLTPSLLLFLSGITDNPLSPTRNQQTMTCKSCIGRFFGILGSNIFFVALLAFAVAVFTDKWTVSHQRDVSVNGVATDADMQFGIFDMSASVRQGGQVLWSQYSYTWCNTKEVKNPNVRRQGEGGREEGKREG